jgi:hypothetical protein
MLIVILLTQVGKLEYVSAVPDAAVGEPDTLTELVAVAASKVSVLDPATAGAANVTVPDVSPDMTSELIYFLLQNYPTTTTRNSDSS